jgi:hypothetical protein
MREGSAIGPGLPNPVYPDLERHLIKTTAVPDDIISFVLVVCSAYAYGDASTVATVMDRLGLTRNRCRMISERSFPPVLHERTHADYTEGVAE